MASRIYKNAEGERLPGVTTVIGSNLGWNKQPLMHWAWEQGMNGLHYRDQSQKAADSGTVAHSMIEADLKGKSLKELVNLDILDKETMDKAENAYIAFLEWTKTVNFELLKSEHSLVSEQYQYGGTIDVAAIQNETCIIDLKTSSGVYADHKIQLAAYGQLWNENYPDDPIKAYYILQLGKEDASFAYYRWYSLPNSWKAFTNLLELHSLQKALKKGA